MISIFRRYEKDPTCYEKSSEWAIIKRMKPIVKLVGKRLNRVTVGHLARFFLDKMRYRA
jgi:hypothetical protein